MCSRSLELLFLFVMLMLGKPGAYGIEAKNCTAAVNVERNTEYRIKAGDSAIIECPVTYCQKKPEIKWYKKNNHSSLTLHDGQRHTFTWINDNVFVLNLSSVHKNDSGLYHCESISGDQKDNSHYINIIVQDFTFNHPPQRESREMPHLFQIGNTVYAQNYSKGPFWIPDTVTSATRRVSYVVTTSVVCCYCVKFKVTIHIDQGDLFEFADDDTNTTDGHGASKKDKAWIIYLLSSLGALCLIAVSCLGPLYFIWRHPVKNKKISSVSQSEMNVLNSYSDVKYYNDNTIGVPDEGSVPHHGAATPGLKNKHGSTICDDQVSCWKAFRATLNPVHHQSATSIHHFPGEDHDMIVYASLSHGEHSQRSEPSVEIELTEYATIGQKN
ncbi:PREDICTED: B- and T-lymphocyte attenuator [Gekko japonicus]|uniref:B- and T-lymphocyte attenuator n=1 Tax=Gekko japonicus TaxID=146911 RepID=A0ABM1JJ02_GEKJA|nr:PREDICTED: B- and T-lymphocyte attenuator [Gekko japonicus]